MTPPAPSGAPTGCLDDVLQRVNRIRTDHGADPALADLGVLVLDYGRAYEVAGITPSSD
jgi:hypothetical protein